MGERAPIRKISLALDVGHNIRGGIDEGHQYGSQDFIRQAGFNVKFETNGQYHAEIKNDPYIGSITFYRGPDIPSRLNEGVNMFAIIGRDRLREAQLGGSDITEVVPLGFSVCQVSLEIPDRSRYRSPRDLDGKRIATSFPNITQDYFRQHNAEVKIVNYTGKEEGAPAAGAADAVVAIWSSGTTARDNGLKRIRGHEAIPLNDGYLYSEAVLGASARYLEEHGREVIVNQFIERFRQAVGHPIVDLGTIGDNGNRNPLLSALRSVGAAGSVFVSAILTGSSLFSTRK